MIHNPIKTSFLNAKLNLAKSKNPWILEKLSRDKDWRVRFEVAANFNTPAETMITLAKDNYGLVRMKVYATITMDHTLRAFCSPPTRSIKDSFSEEMLNELSKEHVNFILFLRGIK